MKFRTEIEKTASDGHMLDHNHGIVMLGSCFTDNIGARLTDDGFNTVYNPMGALYNPESIATCLLRALENRPYQPEQMYCHSDNVYHCLDYANRYQGTDADILAAKVNADLAAVRNALTNSATNTLIVTFGSAWVYYFADTVAGNCHKLPGTLFERRRLDPARITALWNNIIDRLPEHINVIFTVSPIRHLADGLHGNQLSKATLLLAVDKLCSRPDRRAAYFPAYEIVLDDLRDYRFYASDMKHPSETAVDYIYEIFSDTYFSPDTRKAAEQYRKAARAALHRPLL